MKLPKTVLILVFAYCGIYSTGFGQTKSHLIYKYKRAIGHQDRQAKLQAIRDFVEEKEEISVLINAYSLHGRWLFEIGEYANSKAYLDSAIVILETYKPEKSDWFSSYNGSALFDVYDTKADLYRDLGNLPEARKWYERSIEERQKNMHKGLPAQVTPYLGLGILALDFYGADSAKVAYEEVEEKLFKVTGTLQLPYVLYVDCYTAQAFIQYQLGDFKGSISKANQAPQDIV